MMRVRLFLVLSKRAFSVTTARNLDQLILCRRPERLKGIGTPRLEPQRSRVNRTSVVAHGGSLPPTEA